MGVLKNDVGRPSNKTIRTRFILKLIGLILVVGLAFFVGYKLSDNKEDLKQNTEQNKVENKEENKKEEEKVDVEPKKVINIYGHTYEANEYAPVSMSIRDYEFVTHAEDTNKYNLVGTYNCKNEDCVLKEQESKDLETVIIKDGDYIVYNFKTKKSNIIELGNINIDYVINEEYACRGLGSVCIISEKIKNETYYKISAETEDGAILGLIGPDYKPIFLVSNKEYNEDNRWKHLYYGLTILDNGDLLYHKNDKYYEYDSKTKKITASKQYKTVEFISEKGYIVVVDVDNYLKVLDFNGNVKARLVKITDDMFVHSLLSGWYEENKKEGIYVVVEDKNTKFEELSEKLKNELGSPENGNLGYEYFYIPSTGEYGKIATYIGGYAKPVLYLYPKKDNTKVTVDFAKEDLLVTTYPKFKDKWEVTANKNGDLYDSNGKYYYGLYWDEKGSIKVNFDEGFYVTKENAIEFLEEKLSLIGLNDRERNEFIMYWLPILERNEKNLVYFELTSSREAYNKLIINPKPDSLLRVAIHIKKVDSEISIKEQKLKTFERKGFAAVEWGGVIH